MEAESRGQPSAVLETIRRALGRLATQARVHRLDLALVPPVRVRRCSVRAGQMPDPGRREHEIHSPAVTVALMAPAAAVVVGGALCDRDADSLFYCRISANSAFVGLAQSAGLRPVLVQRPGVQGHTLVTPKPAVNAVDTGGRLGRIRPAVFTRPMAARDAAVVHATPTRIADKSMVSGRAAGLLENGLPGTRGSRVLRVPPALVERIPLDRQALPMPSRDSLEWQAAYLQERQLLAHAAGAGVSFSEIDLVGIYRAVPITAARRLEVEKGTNSLLLYLRPQVACGTDSSQKTVVSIAIGRVRGDGRLVRSVIRH